MTGVTVAIPVGPEKHHQDYLQECLSSVAAQTLQPAEVLVIDDMAGLRAIEGCRIWHTPWRLGVAAAYNAGVALAENELVFMLGADDKLMPTCLEHCVKKYEKHSRRDGYYWVSVEYSDGREVQFEPCNLAMVTKGLWKLTGGFAPEVGSGACDAAFLSILLGNDMLPLAHPVGFAKPLAWYRVHSKSDTAGRAPWQNVILQTRKLLTDTWKQPAWGRYS